MTIAPPAPPQNTETPDAPAPAPRPRRRWRRLVALISALICAGLAITYLIAPSIWQWNTADPIHVRDQITSEEVTELTPTSDDANLLARLRAVPTSPMSPPVVLTYHDISDTPGFYNVTPAAFAAQMKLLHDAGYNTITAGQLSAWMRNSTPLPPHAVLLTFDDGVAGNWKNADPILARYNQHAMAFIITGYVGTRNSYYMNWPEITGLAATGRWDIESHTNLGHRTVATDVQNDQAPFLTTRRYLAIENRLETDQEYQNRVAGDLTASVRQLTGHGLPAPAFFAYPYSADSGDPAITDMLTRTVRSTFQASMLNESGGATTTPEDLAVGRVHRTDVIASTSQQQWVGIIEKSVPLTVAGADPFGHPEDWADASNHPGALPLTGRTATLNPTAGAWGGWLYARERTRLWTQYDVSAELGGLGGADSGATTGLRVLVDTPQQVQLAVSAGHFQVRQGSGPGQRIVGEGNLPVAGSYPVSMQVAGTTVTVSVQGRTVATVSTAGPTLAAGGIEITAQREKPTATVPQVSNLTVRPN